MKTVKVTFEDSTDLSFLAVGEGVGVWKGDYQMVAFGRLTEKIEDIIPPVPPIPGGVPVGDYFPTALTMVKGSIVGGGIPSLNAADGIKLKVQGEASLQWPGYFFVEYLVDIALPGNKVADFTTSMIMTYAGSPTYVALLNQLTGAWIPLNSGLSKTNAPAPPKENIGDPFVDGKAHFKVTSYKFGSYINEFDYLKLTVK
jgi:hypothetical protein